MLTRCHKRLDAVVRAAVVTKEADEYCTKG